MTRPLSPDIEPKLRKLAHMAGELRSGRQFNITRLTVLKRFCDDPEAATQFAAFLARQAQADLDRLPQPVYISEERLTGYRQLVADAIRAMDAYLDARTKEAARELSDLRYTLEQRQSEYRNIPFGVVRLIENRQALIVETALGIVLSPVHAANQGYQIARMYAERYDPSYGTGLIPDSAPAVETIVYFWTRYYEDPRSDRLDRS